MRFINEGGAESVKHGLPHSCEERDRGGLAIPNIISHRQALATGPLMIWCS
jgi:hypothetical protein